MASSLSAIPAFRRSVDGTWREITESEWAQATLQSMNARCRVTLEYTGDEMDGVQCRWTMGNHPKLIGCPGTRLHEDTEGVRRWWNDEQGDTHAWSRPGTVVPS